jgi:glutathione S-transferase
MFSQLNPLPRGRIMKLYSGPLSLFARKIEIALGEKGVAFEREMVPFSQERGYSPKHPAVLAVNPKGQVPVLADGNLVLFDSTVIFEYLEDAYPEPPLYPKGAAERARCRLLELNADEILLPEVRKLMHRSVPPDPALQEQREAEARRGEAALLQLYGKLQAELGGRDYLCGALSVADIASFMAVLFTLRLKGPQLGDFPELAAWYARLGARPVFARVAAEVMTADRELSPYLYR